MMESNFSYILLRTSANQDSESLYNVINEKLLSKKYAKNLVAIATDGASVLRGKNNFVNFRIGNWESRKFQNWELGIP